MINNFKDYVCDHYEKRRKDEGLSGDGVYQDAMYIIQAHTAGEAGHDLKTVTAFMYLISDFNSQRDPEFDEFLRLQKKFVKQ